METKTDLPVVGKYFRKLFCYGFNGIDKVFYFVDPSRTTDRIMKISFDDVKTYHFPGIPGG